VTIPDNDSRRRPPYKTAGAVSLVLCFVVLVAVYLQFRGDFAPTTQLTMPTWWKTAN
jgi:phospholipid/cholesterol/gamma-HCH transport system substrate-binding protein